jgi:hypothetical protein
MNKGKDGQEGSADLRRRAEARLIQKSKSRKAEAEDPATATEMQRLVQELQIHQIELEMQNEELTRARDEAERSGNATWIFTTSPPWATSPWTSTASSVR